MKVTYVEKIENKTAFNRNKYCACGSHEYQIVEQLEPETDRPWTVRCPVCGRVTWPYVIKEAAMGAWISGRYDE